MIACSNDSPTYVYNKSELLCSGLKVERTSFDSSTGLRPRVQILETGSSPGIAYVMGDNDHLPSRGSSFRLPPSKYNKNNEHEFDKHR